MLINGKEITTIISDLDGTLLGQGQSLDPAVFSLIHSFLERGILFVAASGRQYKNMRLLFEPVLAQVPMICENGSLIVEADETIYERNIPWNFASSCFRICLRCPERRPSFPVKEICIPLWRGMRLSAT